MDQFILSMTSTLAANMFTVLFVWGLWHAFTKKERDLSAAHYFALIGPPALMGIGAWLYS